jgi:uncharacterized membrane protein YkvA (DUF1232 family)
MEACPPTRSAHFRHRVVATMKTQSKHLYHQFRIVLRALRHPDVPWYSKGVCGLAVLYCASPIQLIPNFIPVIGQLDDVFVIAMSIKLLKRSAPSMFLEASQNEEIAPKELGVTPPT